MKVFIETDLSTYVFTYKDAQAFADLMTPSELDYLDYVFREIYDDDGGIEEEQLENTFLNEQEWLIEMLGYESLDRFHSSREDEWARYNRRTALL